MENIHMDLRLFDANTQVTTQQSLTEEMKTFYSDYLIDAAEPELVHDQFAQKHPIPANGGKTIQFRRFAPLGKALTALTEGVTPDGQSLSMTTVEAAVRQYGGYIQMSDLLLLTAIDNNLTMATKLLGAQAGRTLDTITREVLVGGDNVQYADESVSARYLLQGGNASAADNNYLTVDCIRRAVRALKNANCRRIDGAFPVIIHPDVAYDLMNDPKWLAPHQYVDTEHMYEGEIGKIEGCRFVESTEAKIFHAADLAGDSRTLLTAGAVSGKTTFPFDGGTAENQNLVLGSNTFVPGFESQLVGISAGEERDLDITFPENYGHDLGGKAVVFHVKCNEVKFEELPELDDEFAKDNDFDTLADLKADIRAKSVEEKEKAAKNAFDDALVDQAVENMTVDMPEGMIEERMDGIVREYAQYMANQGIRIDDYLKMIGTDMKTFRESMRATAEKQARTEVLLAAVAEAENVQISEEDLQAEYEKLGEAYGMKAEDVAKAIDVAGLTADLRRERAMSIISESGVAVEKKAEEPAKTEEASKAKKKPAAKKAAKTEETEGEEAPKAKKTTRKSTKTEEKTEE